MKASKKNEEMAQCGRFQVSIILSPKNQVCSYGVMSGSLSDQNTSLFDVDLIYLMK